jgi:hypothetical protein
MFLCDKEELAQRFERTKPENFRFELHPLLRNMGQQYGPITDSGICVREILNLDGARRLLLLQIRYDLHNEDGTAIRVNLCRLSVQTSDFGERLRSLSPIDDTEPL